MIFAHTWEAVLAGEKTQTRRECMPYHVGFPVDGDAKERVISAIGEGKSYTHWVVGRTYAVQPGRGKDAVGRIEITAIRYCARASDISEGDARAEGFATPEEFRCVYARINGAAALERACWVLSFRLIT